MSSWRKLLRKQRRKQRKWGYYSKGGNSNNYYNSHSAYTNHVRVDDAIKITEATTLMASVLLKLKYFPQEKVAMTTELKLKTIETPVYSYNNNSPRYSPPESDGDDYYSSLYANSNPNYVASPGKSEVVIADQSVNHSVVKPYWADDKCVACQGTGYSTVNTPCSCCVYLSRHKTPPEGQEKPVRAPKESNLDDFNCYD